MIDFIRGTMHKAAPTQLVIDCNGMGYRCHVSLQTALKHPDMPAGLYTYVQYSETDQKLFGFLSEYERNIFLQLISVGGIGPSSAINILGYYPLGDLVSYIGSGNKEKLVKISGLGAKTADRLILELKEKPLFKTDTVSPTLSENTNPAIDEAIAALMALGFPKADAVKRVKAVANTMMAEPVDVIIRKALK